MNLVIEIFNKNSIFLRMKLSQYLMSLPKRCRKRLRYEIAEALKISEIYVRMMINGHKPILPKFALIIEKMTKGAVPRFEVVPELYSPEEIKKYRRLLAMQSKKKPLSTREDTP